MNKRKTNSSLIQTDTVAILARSNRVVMFLDKNNIISSVDKSKNESGDFPVKRTSHLNEMRHLLATLSCALSCSNGCLWCIWCFCTLFMTEKDTLYGNDVTCCDSLGIAY